MTAPNRPSAYDVSGAAAAYDVSGGAAAYDALLLVSFGGPEGPDDVLPFLENVTRGRGIPRARLEQVGEHYHLFGGVSPINGQNRALLAELRAELAARGPDLPVYWGNRNWGPYLADALREMRADGVRRALAFVTSAYSSYSGCRQYREDIAAARAEVGAGAPQVDKLRHYFNHPGFLEPVADRVREALATLPAAARDGAPLLFSAHSVPQAQADGSGPRGGAYPAQLADAAATVAGLVGGQHPFEVVYQSRSGPPSQPWLEPDVVDRMRGLHAQGVPGVVVVPVGFVSDHMEVVYDLDTEAAAAARELGLPFARAGTVGTDPRFVAMVGELVRERLDGGTDASADGPERPAMGRLGPSHDVCPLHCCPAPRGHRPAAAGTAADALTEPDAVTTA